MKTSRYRIAREADSQNPIIKYIEQVPIVGDVNVDTFLFEFDSEWEGFEKTLVLNIDGKCYADHIDSNNEVILRKEVYNAEEVTFGVYGIKGTGQNKSILSTPTVYMETLPSTWGQIGDIEDLPDRDTWNLYTQEMLALVAEGKLSAQECETILQDIRAIQTAINTTAGNVDSDKQDVARMKQEIAEIIAAAKLKISEYNANAAEVTAEFNRNANSWQVAINQAGNTQVGEVEAEGTTQIGKVADEGTAQKKVVSDEGTLQKGIVETAGTNAVSAIETAKNTAVQRIQEEGASYNNRITTLEEVRAMAEKNFNTSNAVIEGSGQINNALYWNVKRVNKFGGGEVSQDTTTGKNKLEIAKVSLSKPDNRTKLVVLQHPIPAGTYYISWNVVSSTLSELGNSSMSFRKLDSTQLDYCPFSGVKHRLTFTETVEQIYFYISNSEADGVAIEVNNMQIEEGSTGTDYEKYTGGISSPNPSYEQPIKMLTGNVSVEESNKNLVDWGNMIPTINTTVNFQNDTLSVTSTSGTYRRVDYDITELYKLNAGKTLKFRNNGVQKTNSDAVYSAQIQITKKNSQLTYINLQNNDLEYFTHNISNDMSDVEKVTFKIFQNNSGTAHPGTTTIIKPILIVGEDTTYIPHEGQTFPLTLPADMYLGDLGATSNFIFKNEKDSPYYNSSLVENANYWARKLFKYVFTGTESFEARATTVADKYRYRTKLSKNAVGVAASVAGNMISNSYLAVRADSQGGTYGAYQGISIESSGERMHIYDDRYNSDDPSDFANWLAEKYQTDDPIYIVYEVQTPENILITDTTLNAQIDAMWEQMKTYGITNFVIAGGDIAGKLDLDHYVDDRVELESRLTAVEQALVAKNSD